MAGHPVVPFVEGSTLSWITETFAVAP